MTPFERIIEQHLTAHEGHWGLLASLLRAMETDAEAARCLRRQVRDRMAKALFEGYEGREPTPPPPRWDAYRKIA